MAGHLTRHGRSRRWTGIGRGAQQSSAAQQIQSRPVSGVRAARWRIPVLVATRVNVGGALPGTTKRNVADPRHLHVVGISGGRVPAPGCVRGGASVLRETIWLANRAFQKFSVGDQVVKPGLDCRPWTEQESPLVTVYHRVVRLARGCSRLHTQRLQAG